MVAGQVGSMFMVPNGSMATAVHCALLLAANVDMATAMVNVDQLQ